MLASTCGTKEASCRGFQPRLWDCPCAPQASQVLPLPAVSEKGDDGSDEKSKSERGQTLRPDGAAADPTVPERKDPVNWVECFFYLLDDLWFR
jgi:hypothetical protein